MILTADSAAARAANRRKTGNGWHTSFIGKNRNTLKEGEAPPESGALYPMAFLVEKEPGAVVRPHFHAGGPVPGGGAGRRPARAARHRHRRGALHRRLVGLWADRRRGARACPGSPCATPGTRARNTCPPRGRNCARRGPATSIAKARTGRWRPGPTPSWRRLATVESLSPRWRPRTAWRRGGSGCPPRPTATGPDPGNGGGQFWLVLAGNASLRRLGAAAGEILRVRRT